MSELAPLLDDPDPWIRAMTLENLNRLDAKLTIPFAVALMGDDGLYDWTETSTQTVGGVAAEILSGRFHGGPVRRFPIDEAGDPRREMRSKQRWYAQHRRLYAWNGNKYYADRYVLFDGQGQADADPHSRPGLLAIWPTDDREVATYERGASIPLVIHFQNAGAQLIRVRLNRHDARVHHLRLVGPGGIEIPLRTDPTPSPHGPIAARTESELTWLGLWQSASWGFGDALYLDEMYDLARAGRYRFYYRYVPRVPEKRQPGEYERETSFRFWDGRAYQEYYEFEVQ